MNVYVVFAVEEDRIEGNIETVISVHPNKQSASAAAWDWFFERSYLFNSDFEDEPEVEGADLEKAKAEAMDDDGGFSDDELYVYVREVPFIENKS